MPSKWVTKLRLTGPRLTGHFGLDLRFLNNRARYKHGFDRSISKAPYDVPKVRFNNLRVGKGFFCMAVEKLY